MVFVSLAAIAQLLLVVACTAVKIIDDYDDNDDVGRRRIFSSDHMHSLVDRSSSRCMDVMYQQASRKRKKELGIYMLCCNKVYIR